MPRNIVRIPRAATEEGGAGVRRAPYRFSAIRFWKSAMVSVSALSRK